MRVSVTGILALRAAVVGANFAVMMGLAAHLGLADFGALIYLWGIALVVSMLIGMGGPLVLLRGLTNGAGLRIFDIFRFVVLWPCGLAMLGFAVLVFLPFDVPWAAILVAAIAMNALSCVASILRAQGCVQLSMVLRDAGPFMALGLAATIPSDAAWMIIYHAAVVMGLMLVAAIIWSLRYRTRLQLSAMSTPCRGDAGLWAVSVLGMAVAQMDVIAGGYLLEPETLGLYALLRRIANLVALPVSVATWISAAPVSKAFGAGDMTALQGASARGSEIAWYPALLICAVAVAVLAVIQAFPQYALQSQMASVCVVLLCGALLQAYWASSFTVATLSDLARFSAWSRLGAIAIYGLGVVLVGAQLGPLANAVLVTFAISLSSFCLWVVIRRRLGIDTSAAVLRCKRGAAWRLS